MKKVPGKAKRAKMTTRKGKIARMPYPLRMEANRRMRDGHSNAEIAGWLNKQQAVRLRLAELYWSGPITEQNVSQWRQGGFAEWLARSEQSGRD